jgi:hypothetical protein
MKLALRQGYERIPCLPISPAADPVPALASPIQHQKPAQLFFALEVQDAVA